ncbi:MAG: nucleotidyltransferase family protein [Eubacterium sp.]|nr:nucleotidyltransferase family protein [Eubacterium sp.]
MEFRYDFEYLVHLIYCALNDAQPEEKPDDVSFDDVFLLGKEHEVGNIAFLSVQKLNNKPSEELYNEWQVFYYHSIQRNARQLAEYNALTKLLSDNKIRWTEAQGTITKKYYPLPEWRMMSDIDLLVDVENLDKISALMSSLGHKVLDYSENELNVFPEKGTEIEFHTEFFTEFYKGSFERYSGAINHPFEHAVPDEENEYKWVLDDTYYYLYSLLHTIKHFEYAGCGIRRILDLYILKNKLEDKVDMDYISAKLDEFDFTPLYEKLLQLEAYWFEGKEPECDLTETVKDIIMSGNHGVEDIHLRNALRRDSEDGINKAKRRRIREFLFPPIEHIYEGHPEYKEKGYSLFKCRLYRALENLKPSEIKRMINYFIRIKKSK